MPAENTTAQQINAFLRATGPVLLLDIGSGTQDVLLARPGLEPENWSRFVLPTPARLVAQRVRDLTTLKKPVWLYGRNMGGGFTRALQEHMAAGLSTAATEEAAHAIHDNPEVVRGMGVSLSAHSPPAHAAVYLTDYDPAYWEGLLRHAGLPLPHLVVAAAQDHGFHPDGNRSGRMRSWRTLLEASPDPDAWIYTSAPASLTRLAAIQAATGGPVADTGTAALLGALCVPEVADRSWREGVTIVNVGNSHIIGALVYRGKVCGMYEHHTGMRSLEELLGDLHEFRLGWLPDEHVRASGGHGTAFADVPGEAGVFTPTYVFGPRRELLRGHGQFIAPYGDMMLAGCYGLLRGMACAFSRSLESGAE